MKKACGGVLINEAGRVLLRKPANLHKTRVWTFAKGKPLEGETAEQTALREVFEETGVRAKIIRQLIIPPSELELSDDYYLMLPLEETGHFDAETTAIVWATREQADELISMTEDAERRVRDLKILRFAYEAVTAIRGLLPFNPDDGAVTT
jgi:ADP-ribose pyrophosphatase YjhB (NUDIX family)